jgi:hypothetical protein
MYLAERNTSPCTCCTTRKLSRWSTSWPTRQRKARRPPQIPRHGFEIVDKRSGKEVYLDGSWAEMFQAQIVEWQRNSPSQEEVENTLEGYASLAQNPVVMH